MWGFRRYNHIMNKTAIRLFLPLILFVILLINTSQIVFAQEINNEAREGVVTKIISSGKKSFLDELVEFQELEIEVSRGDKKDQLIKVENSAAGLGMVSVQYQQYQVGDKVNLHILRNGTVKKIK